jgi:hypothetical protein
MKSGWCGQLGRPACKWCRFDLCDCPCHKGETPVDSTHDTGVIRGKIGATNRAPSRVLGGPLAEGSDRLKGVG